ncbi:hypothetical protein RISK_001471 [Rhodopirellula islandica]|uniref:Uncharacterized protein n=1 Tax=Rhodopirellula islandica TaxID=595434 RepID=A0A0J1BI91_RHOIS|nr:hypothetical protein RISK_001471 [Rhodopirellula islandica]
MSSLESVSGGQLSIASVMIHLLPVRDRLRCSATGVGDSGRSFISLVAVGGMAGYEASVCRCKLIWERRCGSFHNRSINREAL